MFSLDTCAEILAPVQPHRFVVALLRCAGWSGEAIAQVPPIPHGNIRQRRQDALAGLRVSLAGRERGERLRAWSRVRKSACGYVDFVAES